MKPSKRNVILALSVIMPALVTAGIGWFCIYRLGQYGVTLFVATPVLLGFLSTATLRFAGPQRFAMCAAIACLSGFTLSLAFLVLGWEGVVCMVMAVPLAGTVIVVGAAAGYLAFHRASLNAASTAGTMLLLVLFSAVAESRIHRIAPSFVRADSMIVNASSSEVWNTILRTENLPTPDDWFLKTGVACPRSARITRPGVGGQRVCTLSTGEYVEAIEVWEPERRIRWRALSNPPPLKEVNPLHAEVSAPHLHGFYEANFGEIVIDRLGPSSVNVTRRTWYRHNLYPAAYWKQWCDFGASRVHKFVLREWKSAAERNRA